MSTRKIILISLFVFSHIILVAQQPVPDKPRIISTDIGGTDPDDNQSMAHFLMYSNLFNTEGLISSPSYGHGTKKNILDMIDLYEKDLPKLQQHIKDFPSPAALRAICKQGRHGAAPFKGYSTATEGSDWIITCARKKSNQSLWILVWGGNTWPGKIRSTNYRLGANWYTDRSDPQLFDGKQQGAKTVLKWRNAALLDWAKRWAWLL